MRTSLLPGIWRNILENAKHRESFRLFEIGLEIHRSEVSDGSQVGQVLPPASSESLVGQAVPPVPPACGRSFSEAALPTEIPHLVAALYDRQSDGAAGLFELKRTAECLMPGVLAEPAEAAPYEHPARSVSIVWKGKPVGRLFELHPRLIETGRAAILDLDLRLIHPLAASDAKYAPIHRYPSAAFDLSVVAAGREYAGHLESSVASFAGPLLESIQFLRQYSGPQVGEGRKSVSFRLTVGSPERTLASEEVSEIRAAIIEGMRGLGYELRV
jgi:phenylalanyl-tRNA synthetase beta chain